MRVNELITRERMLKVHSGAAVAVVTERLNGQISPAYNEHLNKECQMLVNAHNVYGVCTSMACPSSRSKVTTHTHSSHAEKRDHGSSVFVAAVFDGPSRASELSNGSIVT